MVLASLMALRRGKIVSKNVEVRRGEVEAQGARSDPIAEGRVKSENMVGHWQGIHFLVTFSASHQLCIIFLEGNLQEFLSIHLITIFSHD